MRDRIPTVSRSAVPTPSPAPTRPSSDLFDDDSAPVVHPHAIGGTPIAMALVPMGIPLLWLILTLVARPSVFSFAAPVAIAMGVCGLGLGLASIRRWSTSLRTWALAALVALSYLTSGVIYFSPPEWLEAVRVLMTQTKQQHWRVYKPDDRTFQVKVPGDPTPTDSPLPGWALTSVRVADPNRPIDVFIVAHGEPPNGLPAKGAEEEWFKKVKELLLNVGNATLVREQPLVIADARARDYEFQLPGDRLAKRVVRVVQSGRQFYYMGVDGPSVTFDAIDVREFWDSFKLLTPVRKK
jgi:hypothetical protein